MSKISNKVELDHIVNILCENRIMNHFIFCTKEEAKENIYVFQQESKWYEEDGFVNTEYGSNTPFEYSFICGGIKIYIIDPSKVAAHHAG